MTTEEVLDKVASTNMIEWKLERFKTTHPRLFKSIIEAMEAYKQGFVTNLPGVDNSKVIPSKPKMINEARG